MFSFGHIFFLWNGACLYSNTGINRTPDGLDQEQSKGDNVLQVHEGLQGFVRVVATADNQRDLHLVAMADGRLRPRDTINLFGPVCRQPDLLRLQRHKIVQKQTVRRLGSDIIVGDFKQSLKFILFRIEILVSILSTIHWARCAVEYKCDQGVYQS